MFFKTDFDILISVIIRKGENQVKSVETQEKLDKKDILKLYTKGIKQKSELKIGIEYERLPLKNSSYRMADYFEDKGVCNFLRRFAETYAWDYIVDDYSLIGLKKGHDTITLEPGCQMEFSLKPEKNINDIKSKINILNNYMDKTLKDFDFSLYEYGISPITTCKNINLLPKRRYGLMAKYLWGILSDVMMRETAGIQICLDFDSEEDAMKKFRIANMLTPFVTAMFANSPIRGGVESGYKSFRALSWLNTDGDRCGFATKFNKDFCFEDYVNAVMNVPMIFFERNSQMVKINGRVKFKDFLENGYEDYTASIKDYELQANLYFPEVRLRDFIEIRNHDCVNKNMLYSLIAFYKGIFYSKDALNAVDKLLSKYTYQEISELRYNVPRFALEAKIQNKTLKDISKELMRIAYISLDNALDNEEIYLEPIQEFIEDGFSPADVILLNWNGIWSKDINKLMKYLKSA